MFLTGSERHATVTDVVVCVFLLHVTRVVGSFWETWSRRCIGAEDMWTRDDGGAYFHYRYVYRYVIRV